MSASDSTNSKLVEALAEYERLWEDNRLCLAVAPRGVFQGERNRASMRTTPLVLLDGGGIGIASTNKTLSCVRMDVRLNTMARKRLTAATKRKESDVRVPTLGKDVAILLFEGCPDGGHQGLDDGDYLIELFGNAKGFKKLGRYFLALAELDTSDDRSFHHHFFQIRSLSKTKIELTVRKNKTADIAGML